MDAAFTRTSTSVAPIEGTGAVSYASPRAGCILRSAFIVVAIYPDSRSCSGRSSDRFVPLRFGVIGVGRPTRANLDASTSQIPTSLRGRSPQHAAPRLALTLLSPPPRFSPTPVDTPTPSPPAPAHTPPTPHRESVEHF